MYPHHGVVVSAQTLRNNAKRQNIDLWVNMVA
jgi:hypothetical protein